MIDIIFFISLPLPLIPMALAGQWYLFSLFAAFYVIFVIIEIIAISRGGSVTKRFKALRNTKPVLFWVTIGTMSFMWLMLMLHFTIGG